ncbi:MAG: ribonuclease HI family protein [Candidatus Bathyarchaeota archaeon]|nr:ribonuclease HI family protein [Candidatus Bathyarchaeota archaeon]
MKVWQLRSEELRDLRIYTDGASRGNPGPAAIAGKMVAEDGVVLKIFSKFLGRRTNNESEYEALLAALSLAANFTKGRVQCSLDSELIVKQLNGEYRVRKPELMDLWRRVRKLQDGFQQVTFTHVPRTEENMKEVDKLANRVLDGLSANI